MTGTQLLSRIVRGRTDLVLDALDTLDQPLAIVCEGATLLQWCAYYGDLTALRAMLARGAALDTLGRDCGLRDSAFHGHWQLCEFLLEQGIEVNAAHPDTGETALHLALSQSDRIRYDLVVDVLLRAGADPNAATYPDRTTGAFMRDSRTRGETPLHRAAAFGSVATIRQLVDAGGDPTRRDTHGDSPLSWASWYRRPTEVLRLLLHGEHRIHPDHRPLSENLLGGPLGPVGQGDPSD